MQKLSEYLPRIVLCATWGGEPAEVKLPYDWVRYDRPANPQIRASFEASACHVADSFRPADFDAIGQHESVSYFVSGQLYSTLDPIMRRVTIEVLLSVIERVIAAGATGLKVESAGLAHSIEHWKTLAAEVAGGIPSSGATIADAYRFWGAAFEALVRYPIARASGEVYSCGMHLLAAPDVIVDLSALAPGSTPQRLLSVFCRYVLAERGPESVRSGETFRLDDESRPWTIGVEGCDGYDEDESFFNPFGRFRLSPLLPT